MQIRKAVEAMEFESSLEAVNVEALVERRSSPGMLVLAPPMRLIHINQSAWELIQIIDDTDDCEGRGPSKSAKGLLPLPLREVCTSVIQHLHTRPHAKDWERFELKRLVGLPKHPILIRGFGVPEQSGGQQSRIVILLEEIGRRKEELNEETKQRFHLTAREQVVVQCLTKGWTNKEIAAALNLALPTVKEHIRHIMEKTRTSTRTAIVVQLFRK